MKSIQKFVNETSPAIKQRRTFSHQDILDFEKFMDGFWYEKDLIHGEPKHVRLYDYDAAKKKYGAMGKTGGVFPGPYMEFSDKLEALQNLRERRWYAKKKELEELAQMEAPLQATSKA